MKIVTVPSYMSYSREGVTSDAVGEIQSWLIVGSSNTGDYSQGFLRLLSGLSAASRWAQIW